MDDKHVHSDTPTQAHVEDGNCDVEAPDLPEKSGGWEHSVEDARVANENEHKMSVRQALLSYRWAVAWSLIISMSIIMEGYDTILIGNFYGYPEFRRQFGEYHHGSGWQVAGKWQSALGGGGNAGCIIGSFINGYLVKYFGFKKVFAGSLLLMTAFVFVSFFGTTIELQVVGQVLCG
ncbi:transporter [Penicillium riverlandense]|uniref:transporter n=1 Tax=Penicillium riverlandense TaxID=1903569 RepID=UPI002547D0BC|nr:transporter [Penicillium riverlandense]KAJ5808247.1 transporter [Penicillium riverlandense]